MTSTIHWPGKAVQMMLLLSIFNFISSLILYFYISDMLFSVHLEGLRGSWVRSLDLTTHTSLSPIRRGFAPGFVNYKKGALDSQLQVIKFTSCLPIGRWFSPGTPASSTTKTGRHDIAEILFKVAPRHQKIKSKSNQYIYSVSVCLLRHDIKGMI